MSRTKRLGILPLFFLFVPSMGSANTFFVGYDFGQMAFNEFKHVAGEIGYRFENEHALRFVLFNVALSERHLSSDTANAVEGDNVEGLWRGIDLYYDYPVSNKIYVSPSIGYHDHHYTHTVLGTSVRQSTPSAGFALSYKDDVLGLENLYSKFSITLKYSFKDQEEAILGNSIVKGEPFGIGLAFYIGYEFQ